MLPYCNTIESHSSRPDVCLHPIQLLLAVYWGRHHLRSKEIIRPLSLTDNFIVLQTLEARAGTEIYEH
jgi:hypothetical protein